MTEENAAPPAAGASDEQRPTNQLQVQKIYLKDASFEAPNSPQVFANQTQPKLELELHSAARKLADHTFEVVIKSTATAKRDETTAFICEVELAGLFLAQGFAEEELGPVLGIYCPQLLFPYLRENIASLTVRGGFAPLELQPVNFEMLYARELERRNSEGEGEQGEAGESDAQAAPASS